MHQLKPEYEQQREDGAALFRFPSLSVGVKQSVVKQSLQRCLIFPMASSLLPDEWKPVQIQNCK